MVKDLASGACDDDSDDEVDTQLEQPVEYHQAQFCLQSNRLRQFSWLLQSIQLLQSN